jgi:ABC-2 type transport system permease protein
LFGSIPVVGMGVILVIVSNLIMKVDMPVFIMTVAAVMIMTLGLSALAVGFGAIFPIFNYTNVAQIESSAGGLFFAVTAFFYLGLNMSFWALPLQNFYRYKFGGTHLPWNSFWWAAAGLAVINIVAVAVPLTAGLKSLEEFEQ